MCVILRRWVKVSRTDSWLIFEYIWSLSFIWPQLTEGSILFDISGVGDNWMGNFLSVLGGTIGSKSLLIKAREGEMLSR